MKLTRSIHLLAGILIFSLLSANSIAQEKQKEKIVKSTAVIKTFSNMQENIPAELMRRAEGIVIVPNLINAGLGIGGKRGKGVAMVKNENGTWSNPIFITITGGSIGFQAGVQSVDLVMVFLDRNTLENIGTGDFTLGGDISVAAGPVGRSSSANTNYKLEAEVYSYSRSRGLFAGISLNGASLAVDTAFNNAFYKSDASVQDIFSATKSPDPSVTTLKAAVKDLH
jgi:lipid-binding SYLF domain-containing protein